MNGFHRQRASSRLMSSGSVLCLNMEQARSNTAELLRVRELEALGHLIIQHFQIRGGMILVPYPCLRCSSVVVVVVVVVVVGSDKSSGTGV